MRMGEVCGMLVDLCVRKAGGLYVLGCGPSVATYEEVKSFVVPLVRLESAQKPMLARRH